MAAHLSVARSPTTLVRPSQRQDETITHKMSCSDFRDSLLISHTCRPKLPLRAPPLAPRADGHVMLHALPVLVRKPCSASSKTAGGSQDQVTDVLTSLHSNMVRKSLRTCRSWCSPRQCRASPSLPRSTGEVWRESKIMSSAPGMCHTYPDYTSGAPEDVSTALHGSGEGSLCTQGHAPCGSPLYRLVDVV